MLSWLVLDILLIMMWVFLAPLWSATSLAVVTGFKCKASYPGVVLLVPYPLPTHVFMTLTGYLVMTFTMFMTIGMILLRIPLVILYALLTPLVNIQALALGTV